MIMTVTVINKKNKRATVCCASQAARMVGVHYSTVLRWAYQSKAHEFNNFTLYFDTVIEKQQKGKHLKNYVYA